MATNSKRVYYKQDRLKQLRAFCHSAASGGISRAAERMFLSQPSVSLLVHALEKELDTALFDRRGPRIHLTPAGHRLYALAAPLIEGLENLPAHFIESFKQVITGELHIAASETVFLHLLPDVIREFSRRHPAVRFHLHSVAGRNGLPLLSANEAELMVGTLLEVPADIAYRPLTACDQMLITPTDHPLAGNKDPTLADIAVHGLILPPRHSSSSALVNLVFQRHEIPCRVTLEAGSWEAIKQLVARGLGISICPGMCLTGEENLAVAPLARHFPKRSYGVITRKAGNLSPAAGRFIQLLGETSFKGGGGGVMKSSVHAL
ncbi:MAG TPA: LysR family transcriptional regulator [Gammaproteobacteria bacterium]|nr:LysR family transcriptional regulator [Gammaproteobacteria bacterium]